MLTHHDFIKSIAVLALSRLNDTDKRKCSAMITYGVGRPNLRGVTYYNAWKSDNAEVPLIEVCAMGQSDPVQLAGTTIHELGHVLAGHSAGHGKEWKEACALLGLNGVKAVGTEYTIDLFADDIRSQVESLIANLETDGPAFQGKLTPVAGKKAPACPAGIGTQGGKSRGQGSGSRMLKFSCTACEAVWRMAGKWAESATSCPCCQSTDIAKPE